MNSGNGGIEPYIGHRFRAYSLWKTVARYVHLNGTVTESSKGHCTVPLLSQRGRELRKMDFMNMGPLLYFFYSEVNSLIRNSAVWIPRRE